MGAVDRPDNDGFFKIYKLFIPLMNGYRMGVTLWVHHKTVSTLWNEHRAFFDGEITNIMLALHCSRGWSATTKYRVDRLEPIRYTSIDLFPLHMWPSKLLSRHFVAAMGSDGSGEI
jgi:hypothetical protein